MGKENLNQLGRKKFQKLYLPLLRLNQVRCCLSGLLIKKPKDLTVEHYVPKSRTVPDFSQSPYNIRPAIKIINTIKGALLPCEWVLVREERLLYALMHYKLTSHNKSVIIKALDRFATEKDVLNPCQHCILSNAKEQCDAARNLAGHGISGLSSFKSR